MQSLKDMRSWTDRLGHRRSQSRVVIRTALLDFPFFGCVLTSCLERFFDDVNGSVEQAQHHLVLMVHKIGNELPALDRVCLVGRP